MRRLQQERVVTVRLGACQIPKLQAHKCPVGIGRCQPAVQLNRLCVVLLSLPNAQDWLKWVLIS